MTWLVFTLISALLIAIAGIMQKEVLEKEHALSLLIFIFFFGIIFLIPFNIKGIPNFTSLPFHLILLRSITLTVSFLLSFKALRHLDISIAAPLRNLSPFFLLIISFFLLNERLSIKEYLGVLFLIIGAYYLTLDHKETFKEHIGGIFSSKYILYSFASVIVISFTPVIEKIIFNKHQIPVHNYLFVSYIMCFAILISWYFFNKFEFSELVTGFKSQIWIILSVSFFQLLSSYFIISAIAIPGSLVSLIIPIRRFSNVLELFIGGKLLHEKHLLKRVVAGLVIFTGAVVILI